MTADALGAHEFEPCVEHRVVAGAEALLAGRDRRIQPRHRLVELAEAVLDRQQRLHEAQRRLRARPVGLLVERQRAIEAALGALGLVEPRQRGRERGMHARCGDRIVGEARVNLRLRRAEHLAHGQVAQRQIAVADRREQIAVEKADDRVRTRGLGACVVLRLQDAPAKPGGDHEPGHEHRDGNLQALAPRAQQLDLAPVPLGRSLRRLGFATRHAPRFEPAQAARELADIAKAVSRIAMRGGGDVLAQQRVGDALLPARVRHLLEVANDELVEQHAERIEIGLHGRRVAGEQLRREIAQGARGRVVEDRARQRQALPGDAELAQARLAEHAAAAEVDDAHEQPAGCVRSHEHVLRLQILVQHADAMRGGDRLGNPREQFDPRLERLLQHAAMRGIPLVEAQAGIGHLDEERRRGKIPAEQRHQILARAERLGEHAAERELALERVQAVAVARELEHACLAARRVADAPDLRPGALAERAFEPPAGPRAHLVAGPQASGRLGRQRRFRRAPLDGGCEAVADAMHGHDDRPVAIADLAAQACDRRRQRTVADMRMAVDLRDQFVLADHLAGVVQQHLQHFERPRFDVDRTAGDAQLPLQLIELDLAKAPDAGLAGRLGR